MNLPNLSPEPQAPLRDPNRSPFNSPFYERLCLSGLALGVIAGALVLIGAFGDRVVAAAGISRSSGRTVRVLIEQSGFVTIGIVSMVLLVLCIALPWAWARLTGIGVLTLAASVCLLIVVGARSNDRFLVFQNVSLQRAGWILWVAGLMFTAGLVLALVGAPRIGRPPVAGAVAGGAVSTSGYAIAGLVLSLCGVFGGVSAALGIAMSVAGLDDIRRSEGTRGGRGLAIGGLVVGIVILASAAAFGIIGGLVAEPSLNRD